MFTLNVSNNITESVTMLQLKLADISKALTETVLDKAFKVKTESADFVERISITRAAPVGEGLLSAVYRIHVVGKHHNATFIAKGLVKDEFLRNTLDCAKYFKRETYFFSTMLPAFLSIQKKLGAKETLQCNIPVCYDWYCDGHNDYLLLEDLAERGYETISKTPTICERNATLRTLAHLHAVSLALSFIEPGRFTKITDELYEIYYYEENRNWYDEYYQNAIKFNVAALAEYEDPETSVYYKRFMDLLKNNAYSILINLVSERGDYFVICHGDSWCPNFLYSNRVSVAIDFQLTRCASPMTDVSYFILVSNLCRNKQDFNTAIEVYYMALQHYLSDMKLTVSQIYPRASLEADLKKYGKYGLLASLSSFSLLASERCDMLQSYGTKYSECDKLPLAKLWQLTPFQTQEDKRQVLNAVRVAVDAGLI